MCSFIHEKGYKWTCLKMDKYIFPCGVCITIFTFIFNYFIQNNMFCNFAPIWDGGGYAPGGGGGEYLGMVGRFRGDDPRFWDFQSDWVPFSAPSNPSNSQACSDWPLIVLIFNPIDPLFSISNPIDPLFLNPVRSDWVHFVSLCWASLPKLLPSTPGSRSIQRKLN